LRETSSDEEDIDEESSDEIKEHVNNPNIPRLTQADRNKIKRRKIHEATVRKNKEKRMLKGQKLDDALKDFQEREKMLSERLDIKKQKEELNKLKPKRLGKEKYEEKEIEVMLSEELPNSLRELTPKIDLLEDRFLSLQKRNMIETRSAKNYNRRYPLKLKVRMRHREYINEQEKKYQDKTISN